MSLSPIIEQSDNDGFETMDKQDTRNGEELLEKQWEGVFPSQFSRLDFSPDLIPDSSI